MELQKDSIQFNAQDLDQEQNMDVNPVQLNTQNVRVFINHKISDFSGKIAGVTYLEKSKEIISETEIFLYFGSKSKSPVYRTSSDNNGNFLIEDIPPGYYILHAKYGEILEYQSHYIKVLPGEKVNHVILLK